MKKLLTPLVAILLIGTLTAFTSIHIKKSISENEVTTLIEKAYIHGAFNELNPEAMAKGFHEDFAIFSAKGEALARYEIKDWVEGVKKRKASADYDPAKNVWKHKFAYVDVTGNSASVKVELSKDGKLIYTDYLSLLKFESGWRIVAKVYTKH
ncbi:MAG: nuclear transport factor 2 family protein [Bacteroidota bacterium]